MTMTLAFPLTFALLDGEQQASVARLDDDLTAIAQSAPSSAEIALLDGLRRRVLTAYRDALTHAAGQSSDPRWRDLIAAVVAMLAHAPSALYSYAAERAVMRLQELVAESPELV